MSLINERIKEIRKEMGLTQEEYAQILGIKRCTLASYEEHRALPPIALIPKIMSSGAIPTEKMYEFLFESNFSTEKIEYTNDEHDKVLVQDGSLSN